jgi:hypothetical protein
MNLFCIFNLFKTNKIRVNTLNLQGPPPGEKCGLVFQHQYFYIAGPGTFNRSIVPVNPIDEC